jgi:hypothetical protein
MEQPAMVSHITFEVRDDVEEDSGEADAKARTRVMQEKNATTDPSGMTTRE